MAPTTPHPTPVAPAPGRRQGAPSESAAGSPHWVTAPAVVVFAGGERELVRGSLTIGRIPDADIVLDDPLASRMHARISVLADGCIAAEDLHSSNGVYVNGVRLARNSQRLRDGDRLLIGTSELSVFVARRPMLVPGEHEQGPPPAPPQVDAPLPARGEPMPPTDRADALDVIGRLARRLFATGNSAEAVRVMSGHLNKVLLGSSAGLGVSDRVLSQATEYALELQRWSGNTAWFDYVVELHLSSRRVPSDASLDLLDAAFRTAGPGDPNLLRYYVESLEVNRRSMSSSEATRFTRLLKLLPTS